MTWLIERLSYTLALIAALALGLMMLHVTADVAAKYLLNSPIPGTAEVVASYYMVSAVFLPLAWLEVKDGAIVVELIFSKLPTLGRRILLVLASFFTCIFYGGLAWLSWGSAVKAWQIGEVVEGTWRVVIWPTKFLLPLGLGIACVVAVLRLMMYMSGSGILEKQQTEPCSGSKEG